MKINAAEKMSENDRDTTHQMRKSVLSRQTKLCYSLGHIENDLCASGWFSYLLVFLRTVLLFPSTSAGGLLLIGQVMDGLATPVVGIFSDKTHSAFGKRRLWILIGSLCVTVTFPFIFHSIIIDWFDASNRWRFIYYAFFITLFQFAWAAVQVNHMALVPELSEIPSDRVFLNSVRSIATIVANVTVFILAGILLSSQDGPDSLGPDDANSFFVLAMICVVVGTICSAIFIIGVREPVARPKREGSVVMQWHHWFNHREFYETAIVYTCTRVCCNVSQVFLPMYLVWSLSAPKGMIASIPFTIFATSFISTILCERLSHFLSSEKLTMVGSFIVLISSVAWGSVEPEHYYWAYAVAVTAGFGIGFCGVASLGLICETVGDSCESSAFVYGSMSFADKITNGIVIMAVESFSRDGADAAQFYRWVQVWVPGVSAVIAIIVLTFILLTRPVQRVTSPCARLMRINSGVMTGLSGVSTIHERRITHASEATPLLSTV